MAWSGYNMVQHAKGRMNNYELLRYFHDPSQFKSIQLRYSRAARPNLPQFLHPLSTGFGLAHVTPLCEAAQIGLGRKVFTLYLKEDLLK